MWERELQTSMLAAGGSKQEDKEVKDSHFDLYK